MRLIRLYLWVLFVCDHRLLQPIAMFVKLNHCLVSCRWLATPTDRVVHADAVGSKSRSGRLAVGRHDRPGFE